MVSVGCGFGLSAWATPMPKSAIIIEARKANDLMLDLRMDILHLPRVMGRQSKFRAGCHRASLRARLGARTHRAVAWIESIAHARINNKRYFSGLRNL
jgi:hypothetical protein